jgi:1,4-dihydroxy-2-naphthoyl-CoA hydrolase
MAEDFTEMMNGSLDGWCVAMGVRFVRATKDEVVAELDVGAQHRQPYGLVHGGVYAGLVETVASVGAGIHAMANGRTIVGLENHTSFLHAVRDGVLRATALPLTRGRQTHVWEVTITDATGRSAATGQVRFLCLEAGAAVAGETVAIKPTS